MQGLGAKDELIIATGLLASFQNHDEYNQFEKTKENTFAKTHGKHIYLFNSKV